MDYGRIMTSPSEFIQYLNDFFSNPVFINPVVILTVAGLIFEFVPIVLQYKRYGWPFKSGNNLKGSRDSLKPITEGSRSKDEAVSNFKEFVDAPENQATLEEGLKIINRAKADETWLN